MNPNFRYDIHFLRATAVALVVLYHFGLGIPGGFIGVDVFFVISGYLISKQMLTDIEEGSFSIISFWEKRLRRLVPAMLAVLLVTWLFAYFLFLPSDFAAFGRSAIAYVFALSNVYFWKQDGGYFSTNDVHPLLHTWSLSVEEQFYLFLPLLLISISLVSRRRGFLKATLIWAAVLLVASLTISEVGARIKPDAAFYLMPTRAWELALGVIVAILHRQNRQLEPLSRIQIQSISLIAVGVILAASLTYRSSMVFPGLAALPPCAAAALIIYLFGLGYVRGNTGIENVFRNPVVLFLGNVSYSLYLWHWPVIVFMEYGDLPISEQSISARLMGTILALTLAALSLRYVEEPFRKRKVVPSPKGMAAFSAVAALLMVTCGVAAWRLLDIPHRFMPTKRPLVEQNEVAYNDRGTKRNVGVEDVVAGRVINFGIRSLATPTSSLLIWGDSHARTLIPSAEQVCSDLGISGYGIVYSSTPPVIGAHFNAKDGLKEKSVDWADAVIRFIAERNVKVAILAARWSSRDAESSDKLREGLIRTINHLSSNGVRVIVVLDTPRSKVVPARAIVRNQVFGWASRAHLTTAEEHLLENRTILDVKAACPNAIYIDPSRVLVVPDGKSYMNSRDGVALYYDDNHLTATAARLMITSVLKDGVVSALHESNKVSNVDSL